MHRLPLGPLYYEFIRHNEPRLRVNSGDTILVETEDAFSGQVRTNDDRRDIPTFTPPSRAAPRTQPAATLRAGDPGEAAGVGQGLVLAVEEAMNNVVKHSGADEATLGLEFERTNIIITVTDNGRGLPAEILPRRGGGHGLPNLRQRLERLGGQCEINNRPEGGLRVVLRAPVEGI